MNNKLVLIFLLIFVLTFNHANSTKANSVKDTLSVEQIAFNYFIEKLDSFRFSNGKNYFRFNKIQNKIFCYPFTRKYGALNFVQPFIFKKPDFIVFDTTLQSNKNRKPRVYAEDGCKEISFNLPYILNAKRNDFEKERKEGDIEINISNKYDWNNFYYVRINVYVGIRWIFNEVYLKLSKEGTPLDWVQTSGME